MDEWKEDTYNGNVQAQLDRIEAKLDQLLARKKPKKSLLNEWIPPSYVDQEIWDAFLKHRKEKKQALKEESYKWCLREMDKMHKAGHDVDEAITKSIANGYTGIFAPTKPQAKNQQPEIFSQAFESVDVDKIGRGDADLDTSTNPYAEDMT